MTRLRTFLRRFSFKAGYLAGFHQAERLARHDQVQR